MSNLSSQADPPTFKNLSFILREFDVRKNKVLDLKMLLMVFWNCIGLMLGALGACLGDLLVLLQAFGGTLNSQNFLLASLPGQIVCCFFFASSFAPFFEVVVFLILESLGVEFKLSS